MDVKPIYWTGIGEWFSDRWVTTLQRSVTWYGKANANSFQVRRVSLWPRAQFILYRMVMEETGIRAIAHGGKAADGLWRRRLFANTAGWKHMIYPIKGWSKYDVLAYLHTQKIPIPQESIANTRSGMDLSTPTMLWLFDNYPDDFTKVQKVFPYVEAIVWRRQWYGAK